MNAVDANVLVYAVDAAELDKSRRALEVINELTEASPPLLLLWQTATEFLACLRRWESQGRITRKDTISYLERFVLPLPLAAPALKMLDVALELSSKHSLSHWDSLLLAACIEAGVTTRYSEDMTDGETYGSVTVRNPFRDLKAK